MNVEITKLRPGELTTLSGIIQKKYHAAFSILSIKRHLNFNIARIRLANTGFVTEVKLGGS
jgi:hypothetical protein